MKINLLEKNDDKIVFEIKDSNPVFANTLRRSIVNKVPVMATEKIDITVNSSALYDEMLAHRIGLVPIKFPAGKYKRRDDCTCKGKGCANCEVKGVVKKKGTTLVCGEDIKFTDKDVSAKNPKELIVKLIDGL
ncbi:MAG: DNA-directed RNA polymerase subunit D, partial [Candidatus Aenigmarchaeota archaeon]|nr:DNA-directed RNA polymerase subunit D [Candidatus Aenigmarchaeota archaeon]